MKNKMEFLYKLAKTSLILLVLSSQAFAVESLSESEYQSAIEQARVGNYDSALAVLRTFLANFPDTLRYRYDYVTVLGWAGRDAEVFSQIKNFDLSNTPAYVLASLAKAARNTKHFEVAIKLYQTALTQNKNQESLNIGLVLTLTDAKRSDEALTQIESLLKKSPRSIPFLEAQAYIYESKRDFFHALSVHEKILRLSPQSASALRGRIMNLSHLGAPQIALELAKSQSGYLSQEDISSLISDEAALLIRWGRLGDPDPSQRYKKTDQAINLLTQQLNQLGHKNSRLSRRMSFDLLVAYHDRRLMQRAIDVYEKLKAQDIVMPPYVLHTMGDAYLYLKKPEKAQLLLEKSLRLSPQNLAAEISLFYAYLESGQYQKALSFIDQVASRKKQWIESASSGQRTWNPEKFQADATAALARSFVGDLSEGQARLQRLLKQAPSNTGIRSDLAYVALWRGKPRQAFAEFTAISTLEPDHLGAKVGAIEALSAMGDLNAAEKQLPILVDNFSDELSIKRLTENLQIQKSREVSVNSNVGVGSSSYAGSRDFRVDAYYFDRYIANRWRPFVHASHQRGNFSNTPMSYSRMGVGFDYLNKNINATVEINSDDLRQGALVSGTWSLNDEWQFRGALNSNDSDISLRARSENINAKSANFGVSYRLSESTEITSGLTLQDYSDGNNRFSHYLSARQRMITTPRYRLDGNLMFYQQFNSIQGTAYFNPEKVNSTEVTLVNDWLAYRHYDQSLTMRVSAMLGSTDQQNFSRGMVWNLAHEHLWDIGKRLSLSYGLRYGKSLYDGNLESETRGFITINKRF